jgi:hypothetical protein
MKIEKVKWNKKMKGCDMCGFFKNNKKHIQITCYNQYKYILTYRFCNMMCLNKYISKEVKYHE